jgi:8-oxo-dGTP diphosphatase
MTRFYVAAHGLVHRDGLYLATRRSPVNTYKPGLWDIPGGTVDHGETLEQALHREVREETSLTVSIDRIVHAYTNAAEPGRETVQCVFKCEWIAGEVRLNPAEHDDHKWLSLTDLSALHSMAFVRSLLDSKITSLAPV